MVGKIDGWTRGVFISIGISVPFIAFAASSLDGVFISVKWGQETLHLEEMAVTDWFARPILHVKDVEASLRFYQELLGFTSPWRYDEEGKARVAQVDRQGCALLLANDLTPEKVGKAVMFVSLNVEPATPEGTDAALDALRAELEDRGVRVREGSWGYRLLVVDDPDGNQLLFNYAS